MTTIAEPRDWQEYRELLEKRVAQLPHTRGPIWGGIDPFEFTKWELDVVLIGAKCLPLAKELRREGFRLEEGTCLLGGDRIEVEGLAGGIGTRGPRSSSSCARRRARSTSSRSRRPANQGGDRERVTEPVALQDARVDVVEARS